MSSEKYKMNDRGEIRLKNAAPLPMLRFTQSVISDEWNSARLGELSVVVRGGSPRPIDEFITSDKSGLNWLKIGDVDKEAKFVTKTQGKVRREALVKTREVNPGDLILSNSMSFGRPYLMSIKSCIHDGWIAITEVGEKASREYLYYAISSPSSQSFFLKNAAGSGVLNLNAEIVRNLPIAYPSISEQEVITSCLSCLDEIVEAEVGKLRALNELKSGAVQRLFPRRGDAIPLLRFPEFGKTGRWRKRKVSDLLKKLTRAVDVEDDKNYREIGIRSHGKGIFHKDSIKGKALGEKRVFWVEENALVFNIVFAWEQAIAVTSAAESGMIASHRFPMYKADQTTVDINFIKCLFLTSVGKELLGIASPGGAGRNKTLGQKEFENLELLVPATLEEQQAIANHLSSISSLIDAQVDKVDTLKLHRTGLMQRLFPVLREASN